MPANISKALRYEGSLDRAREVQRRADFWCILGSAIIGTLIFGIFGLPFFIYGLWQLKKAEDQGLPVRPYLMTFVGYLVIIDGFLNSLGWMIDVIANHTLLIRTMEVGWGLIFDAGYAWQFNSLWIGGASVPGEKSWEIANVFVYHPLRVAAAWGFLQGKRWGLQWLIVTCWMGLFNWVGYCFNMTIYSEMRFMDVAAPVWGWWLYDIWYVTPFILIPYLHTINKEIFSDD